jgi:hypothetical protein
MKRNHCGKSRVPHWPPICHIAVWRRGLDGTAPRRKQMPKKKNKMNGDDVRAIVTELREQNALLREQLNGYFRPIMEITRLGAEAALFNHPMEIKIRLAKMRKIADAALERLQGPQKPAVGDDQNGAEEMRPSAN